MSVCPHLPQQSAASVSTQTLSHPKKEGEESLEDAWESTRNEFQCQEKKQKENWLKTMSSLTKQPDEQITPAGGQHIGHYGKFTFGEDEESSGNACSERESSEEEEVDLVKKRNHEELESSDESSDIDVISRTKKKRKLGADITTEELLLPDSDSCGDESEAQTENKAEGEKQVASEKKDMDTEANGPSQASQGSDSLWLDDEDKDGEEKDWDIPEDLRVKPAEIYENVVELSDDELEHHQGKNDASKPKREEEKLLIRLRWKKGRTVKEQKIMVMSQTKFEQINHLVFQNFRVKLKMMFDGEVIKASDTAESLGLEITLDGENADLIDCVLI